MLAAKGIDWDGVERSLWADGYARLGTVFSEAECAALIALYGRDELFRSRIEMRRYRFGEGDYKYFAHPLPELIQTTREAMYERIAPIASRWSRVEYPADLAGMIELCRQAGQTKPTPLLLHYETGGYNCLHQDLYGDVAFPFQMVCLLSQAGRDYTGGEFLLVEQRPRAQSIGQVIQANQGEAILFTTRYRPVKGARGFYRANVKHGVSKVLSGTRYTLGIIFHDAK